MADPTPIRAIDGPAFVLGGGGRLGALRRLPCSFAELFERLAGRQTIEIRMCVTPAGELPSGEDEAIDWLFGRWRELDAWIETP